MKLPTKSGEYEVSADLLQAYRTLFSTADAEFARMRIWLESNKSRRPSRPEAFVRNWFKRVRAVKPAQEVVVRLDLPAGWWADEKKTLSAGAQFGLSPRAGEDWGAFRARIRQKIEQRAA